MTTVANDPAPHGDHGHHEHPKFLAHHFETPQQQFDSGKLGTWLFLTTEILLFSGLFCAYAVYRATHPEIYAWAHEYLDKWLGALNTIVLIFSSFTMAWAVRAAQTGAKNLCVALLGITIACGAGFMCIKAVEYKAKWEHHLFPGDKYSPTAAPGVTHAAGEHQNADDAKHLAAATQHGAGEHAAGEPAASAPAMAAAPATLPPAPPSPPPLPATSWNSPTSAAPTPARRASTANGPRTTPLSAKASTSPSLPTSSGPNPPTPTSSSASTSS